MDDIISKSTGPASDVLEKLIIKEEGKESIIKEEPSVRNIIQDTGMEIIPEQSKSCYEIYLDSGNLIITEFWWKENEMIMYKKFGGYIGIECTRVKKIIKR